MPALKARPRPAKARMRMPTSERVTLACTVVLYYSIYMWVTVGDWEVWKDVTVEDC